MTQDGERATPMIRELELARLQCHESCAEEMDRFLSFCRDALRAVFAFDRSVPSLLIDEACPNDGVFILNEAFSDALRCIQSRSRWNVRNGYTVIIRSPDEMAGSRKIVEINEGKKTPVTITKAIKEGASTHVSMVVQALKVSCYSLSASSIDETNFRAKLVFSSAHIYLELTFPMPKSLYMLE